MRRIQQTQTRCNSSLKSMTIDATYKPGTNQMSAQVYANIIGLHCQEAVILIDFAEGKWREQDSIAMVELVHELHPMQSQCMQERRKRFHTHQHKECCDQPDKHACTQKNIRNPSVIATTHSTLRRDINHVLCTSSGLDSGKTVGITCSEAALRNAHAAHAHNVTNVKIDGDMRQHTAKSRRLQQHGQFKSAENEFKGRRRL